MVLNPPEKSRTYSSIWGNNAIGTGHARSMLDSPQAWSARNNRAGEWMQIDLGAVKSVSGVVTQGRKQGQWVTKYNVKYSTNGRKFTSVKGDFTGNSDRNTKVTGMFKTVGARYVRIFVRSWSSHASMRAGVLVSSSAAPTVGGYTAKAGMQCAKG